MTLLTTHKPEGLRGKVSFTLLHQVLPGSLMFQPPRLLTHSQIPRHRCPLLPEEAEEAECLDPVTYILRVSLVLSRAPLEPLPTDPQTPGLLTNGASGE